MRITIDSEKKLNETSKNLQWIIEGLKQNSEIAIYLANYIELLVTEVRRELILINKSMITEQNLLDILNQSIKKTDSFFRIYIQH